jgi:uncharacterized protein (DUF2141 family)
MTHRKLKIVAWIVSFALFGAFGCSKRMVRDSGPDEDPDPGGPVTIEVVIEGVAHREGVMRLALFDSPDGFPDEMRSVYHRLESPIEADTVTFTIHGVPRGRYAVSVYHDENGDGVMETDFLGRPSEGYGISNDADSTFGPPSFDDASFRTNSDPCVIRISLNY